MDDWSSILVRKSRNYQEIAIFMLIGVIIGIFIAVGFGALKCST